MLLRRKQLSWYSPLKLQTITNLHIKTQNTCWKGRAQGQTTKELLSQKLDHCVFIRVWKLTNFVKNFLQVLIRELYDIHDENAIQSIAISHVVSNLDDAVKGDVKLLQLSGNVKLENNLELTESKMQNNYLQSFGSYHQQQNTPYFQNNPGASNSISNFNPTNQYTRNQYDRFARVTQTIINSDQLK